MTHLSLLEATLSSVLVKVVEVWVQDDHLLLLLILLHLVLIILHHDWLLHSHPHGRPSHAYDHLRRISTRTGRPHLPSISPNPFSAHTHSTITADRRHRYAPGTNGNGDASCVCLHLHARRCLCYFGSLLACGSPPCVPA